MSYVSFINRPSSFLSVVCAVFLLLLSLSGQQASAATIVVTSNANDGAGTLREALTQANSATESTTITFNLGANTTIEPTTALPAIAANHPVSIDGGGMVVLSGENAPTMTVGLEIESDNVTVRGLTIIRFFVGIVMDGADGVVEECRIGTDGVEALGGALLSGAGGIRVLANAERTRIGGENLGNVISGNSDVGIYFEDTHDLRIEANLIGLNAAGDSAIPNVGFGIRGINSSLVRIGKPVPNGRNVIAGNFNNAINVTGCSDTIIEGNIIGLSSARDTLLPNSAGIFFSQGTGTENAIRRNVICGNGISVRSTSNLSIENNFLGVNGPDEVPFPSSGSGISINASEGAVTDIVIGGEDKENVIAHFSISGIQFSGPFVNQVTITQNAIYNNGENGLDISGGANNNMPPPVLTGIDPVSGTAQANALIEFFADDGNQGRFYLGTVQADNGGNFSTAALDLEPHTSRNLTATATDADGNTSPFSAPLAISGIHSADQDGNNVISLSELLRVIQIFNSAGYHCAVPPLTTEDGFVPGVNGAAQSCAPHASDYNPQNWVISLSELLRLIQFFNSGGYFPCESGEDGFCPGAGP